VDRADPRNTKLHRLEENFAAAAVELSDDDRTKIEAVLRATTIEGHRYPPHLEARVGLETVRPGQ
jgi:diketogulonate reductase-like aldo/keto reductase